MIFLIRNVFQTPPSTAGSKKSGAPFSGQGTFFCGRGAPWRCCGNREATLDRERNGPAAAGKWREGIAACNGGLTISPPPFGGYLDLGQSEVFTERSQARWLGEGATAQLTRGGRRKYCRNEVELPIPLRQAQGDKMCNDMIGFL